MIWLKILDLLGVFVFAASGALSGSRKNMDILGIFVLATVTAVGGGSLRSILIGDLPIGFLKDISYLIVCLGATLAVFILQSHFERLEKLILVFDALGLGAFTIIGINIALAKGLSLWASLLMGIITASFGGVVRDILINEIPFIFQKEIYATAALIGGILYLALNKLSIIPNELNICLSAFLICAIRLFSLKLKLSLPKSKNVQINQNKDG